MPVVTLTGELGARGSIPERVAHELGCDLVERELLARAAEAAGGAPIERDFFDEDAEIRRNRFERLMRVIESIAVPGVDLEELGTAFGRSYGETATGTMRALDERYIATLTSVITAFAERGCAVIVGRGAHRLLAEHPGALHVRLVCSFEERVRRITERDRMAEKDARERVAESDRQRLAWYRKYFGVDYRNVYDFHLAVNVERLADADAAALIVQAARATEAAAGGGSEGAS